MSVDPRSGEREDTPEQEAERVARSEAMYLGAVVARLMQIELSPGSADRRAIVHFDEKLNIFKNPVQDCDVQHIKQLAWRYRRQMPQHIAPRLPPHDPIVREQHLD